MDTIRNEMKFCGEEMGAGCIDSKLEKKLPWIYPTAGEVNPMASCTAV